MKIILDKRSINELNILKKEIEDILSINDKELELTDENLKTIKDIKHKIFELRVHRPSVDIKIVSSDGTELTL